VYAGYRTVDQRNSSLRGLDKSEQLFNRIKFVIMSACGTGLNVAKYAKKNLEPLAHVVDSQ